MATYEKADFYAAYSFSPVHPVTRIRFAGARSPEFAGFVDYNPNVGITFRLHYHPFLYRQHAARKAQMLIDAGLVDADSSLVIVGGAYGWLGSELKKLLPTLEAISLDSSQYVQDTKDLSPDAELIESIVASGYDPTLPNSVGEYLFNTFIDPLPRADIPVLTETLSSLELTQNATRIITEEVWQIMSQEEKDGVTVASATWSIPITHIIDGVII
tara:strand:+ start:1885 stop:2529 length:645 start_codon:yes stop_codon:yes gene_type:complete